MTIAQAVPPGSGRLGRIAHAGWQHAGGIPNLMDLTRILFEDFAPAAVRLFYVIACAAMGVFAFGVYTQVRKYRRGAPLAVSGELLTRFKAMVGTVLTHRTIARRDRKAGAAHR